ncbi:MAG: hypothetical protein ACKO2G_07540 [Verrucomicrobiales bacterium]
MEISRCALCIGHPGHELRVFDWMRKNTPLVDVITDGSGPNRESRFASTRNLIEGAGGRLGKLQGAYSDRRFYEMVSEGNPAPFVALARGFASSWEEADIDTVAGDMVEGFSITHDLCRAMINAAVEKLRRRGRSLRNLAFALESMPAPSQIPGEVVLRLNDEEFAAKHAAAHLWYPELAGEVDRLISQYGEDAFRTEILTPVDPGPAATIWDSAEPPFYETYGRKQVAAGHYKQILTHEANLKPLAIALWEWAISDAD